MAKVYDEASKVSAYQGEVLVDGPDGVSVSLTPEAAADTSDRLLAASAQAAGQRRKICDDLEARKRRHMTNTDMGHS